MQLAEVIIRDRLRSLQWKHISLFYMQVCNCCIYVLLANELIQFLLSFTTEQN